MYLKQLLVIGLLSLFIDTTAATENQEGFKIPFTYGLGKNLFIKSCGRCHGEWGKGTSKGPPLMHPVYVSSHHGDKVFYRAALSGVRSHHWKFGDMPPVPGIDRAMLDKIVPYIRWLQEKNGIR